MKMTSWKAMMCGALSILGGNAGAAWSIKTVDATGGAGFGVSLVLNPTGAPAISYLRPTAGFAGFVDVYHAFPSGSAWTKEQVFTATTNPGETTSIALTELGKPVISYTTSGIFLHYATRSAGTWSSVDVSNAAGGFSSLLWQGTESAPAPVVAFNNAAAGDLKYGYFTNAWNTTTLDSFNTSGESCSMAQIGADMGVAYIRSGKLGFYTSPNSGANWGPYLDPMIDPLLAINATYCAVALAPSWNSTTPGTISAHLIYYYGTTGNYSYLTNDTENGLWTTPEVVSASGLQTVPYFGLSIAVGADGVVHVAFLDYGSKLLKHAQRSTAGAWSSPETVDPNIGGITCSLRMTPQNQARIAYGALVSNSGTYAPAGLKYAAFTNATPASSLAFEITTKTKTPTAKSKVTVKGTASTAAAAIEWKLGKNRAKKAAVANGRWKAKVGPLLAGQNKVKFRAVGADGKVTAYKILKITRE